MHFSCMLVCFFSLSDDSDKQTLCWGSHSLGGRTADRRRPVVSTRFTGRLEHLHWEHSVTRSVTRRKRLNALPGALAASSALWIYMAFMNTHKENKKLERESKGEESSCGGVSLFCYGLHMSGGKCSFYPSKALASATERISLPEWNLPC